MKKFEDIKKNAERKNTKDVAKTVFDDTTNYLYSYVNNLNVKNKKVKDKLKNFISSTLSRFNGNAATRVYKERYETIAEKLKEFKPIKTTTNSYQFRINLATEKQAYLRKHNLKQTNARTITFKNKES